MKNEKAEALESDGSITILKNKTTTKQMKINSNENQLVMNNFTPHHKKTQLNFNFGRPPKVFETIHCYQCSQHRELDGFQFKLVPVCSDCRTERELEILSNQIERRAKR